MSPISFLFAVQWLPGVVSLQEDDTDDIIADMSLSLKLKRKRGRLIKTWQVYKAWDRFCRFEKVYLDATSGLTA